MSNKTALIVDDSKLSRVMIRTILQQNFPQWKILEAANGEEALQLAEPSIDVMTLDMNMPGMDGITLGIELRQRYPNASISLITANVQKSTQEQADSADLYFVPKPITEDKILDALNNGHAANEPEIEMDFNEDELDAISEYFNIGMGQAANSLSQMIDREVTLSVPRVNFTSHEQSIEELGLNKDKTMVCISEEFQGLFDGRALLLLTGEDSVTLTKLLSNEESPDIEQDVMNELGNIIINSCLSTIYNLLDSSYECSIPEYTKDKVFDLFKGIHRSDKNDSRILVIEMDFTVVFTDIQGQFRLLMDLSNINDLKVKIQEQLL